MVEFDPLKHHRRSIRLKGYDYSTPGAYFVTVVTFRREELMGEITNGVMKLNRLGLLVQQCWQAIPLHHLQARLDEYIIMPNHIHGIILLSKGEASARADTRRRLIAKVADASPQPASGTKSRSLGAIIQNFKSVSTRKANINYFNPGNTLWQRNYYEHIIRNEAEMSRIREYIRANPSRWGDDLENVRAKHPPAPWSE